MKEYISIAGNKFFSKDKDKKLQDVHEIIIILGEPKYRMTNASELTREREVSEVRFFTKHLDELIKGLEWIKKDTEKPEDDKLDL